MTRKELNEIKSQYTLEDCGILRLCGCYVDGERNKITQFNENFLNLPEEEKHKYLKIIIDESERLSKLASATLLISRLDILIYLRRLFQEHQERIWLI